jgi:C1A family cysteine protease
LSTWTKEEVNKAKGHVHWKFDFNNSTDTDTNELDDQEKKEEYPEKIDWVTKGMVSAVQNQLQCGSCWAFASTATIESAYAIAGNKLTKLSE